MHRAPRAVAAQRSRHGDPLSGYGPYDRPSGLAGDHRSAPASDRGHDDVCGAEHAGRCPKDPRADRHAAIQRESNLRGGRQRRGASRLFDPRQQDPPVNVLRPLGNPLARCASQHPDRGEHGAEAGDAEPSHRFRDGPDGSGRDPRVGAPAVLHGTPRGRCASNHS